MARTIPEIRIKYGWLLAGEASIVMHEKYGDGTPLRPPEYFQDIVDKYRSWWGPHSDEILEGLCDTLDLDFRQNIIDIYVAPWFNPISDPLVIGPAFRTQDSLVNTITHELIHRLLTDNTSVPHDYNHLSDWEKSFGTTHTKNTLVHIPVHSVMKKLYLDVIDRPDLYELDMEVTKNNPPYADAWKYVNDNDYKDIVASLSMSRTS